MVSVDEPLLLMLIGLLRADEVQLMVSFGWVCKRWRTLTRETDAAWTVWRSICGRLMPKEITATSVHRQDLSLTTRSRCYTANVNGYFEPNGGGGEPRCSNQDHYYTDSLEPNMPREIKDLTNYCHWTLGRLSLKSNVRSRRRQKLQRIWSDHRKACEQVAEMPWLFDDIKTLMAQPMMSRSKHEARRAFYELSHPHATTAATSSSQHG